MERFSISVTLGKASNPHGANLAHNNRDFIARNIRRDQMQNNIFFKQQNIHEAYEELFGAAIDDYNAKQKQPCRRIKDYYSHIASGKREEPFYEVIVQLGDTLALGVKLTPKSVISIFEAALPYYLCSSIMWVLSFICHYYLVLLQPFSLSNQV